jgi:hypothetical protein
VVLVVVDAPHASQQLVDASTVPPRAPQRPASRAMAQRGTPSARDSRSTAPGLPHVDLAAHRRTMPRHSGRSAFESDPRPRDAGRARDVSPCCAAPRKSHVVATSARAATTAASSPG